MRLVIYSCVVQLAEGAEERPDAASGVSDHLLDTGIWRRSDVTLLRQVASGVR